ncbi:MAG TPA: bifunctional 5,10-methylenetetrahydrofolate dehydrogenase/5,10-methenyltetrahydrofolate cyclohydrolase [Candidatus Paceibacterota bacterium]|jgi:methylenetetrahydrofolate dehydrogenase (NADP+)/methenyltetrahydrofolate cyclohydrolase
MVIDGRTIAKGMLERTKTRAEALPEAPSFLAIAVAPDPATQSYLRMKQQLAVRAGVRMDVRMYDEHSTAGLVQLLSQVSEDAVIVQLPLPGNIDTEQVLDSIPSTKDADVLSSRTRETGALTHPVAGAIKAVLEEAGVRASGKAAVVVGQGWLVGLPATEWLRREGAIVQAVTKEEGDIKSACIGADIIVSGAGVANLIRPDYVRPGAVVIDIGTSELGGSLAGDVDPRVAEVASVYTPVPGGIGPITVACLLENVVLLAEANRQP